MGVLISPVIDSEVSTENPITDSSLRIFTIPFTVPVGPGQRIDFARVFAQVDILDNAATQLATKVLFNNREIGSFIWAQFQNETFVLDVPVNLQGVKINEENTISILIEQKFSPFFANARWRIFADFFYTVVSQTTGQEEAPPEAPMLGEPEIIDFEDPPDGGIFGFNISDFLFGDTNKIIRTVAIVGGVVAAVILIPPIARAVTATQRLRRKTAV